jgi:type VI protein secretion system component VasK
MVEKTVKKKAKKKPGDSLLGRWFKYWFSGWSWTEFFKGFLSKYFLAWGAATYFVFGVLHNGQSDTIKMTLIITWGVITIIWLLCEAWKKLIENGQLKVDVGASLKVDGAIDKIAEAVKK